MNIIIFYMLIILSCISCHSKTSSKQIYTRNTIDTIELFYEFDLQAIAKEGKVDSGTLNSMAQQINFICLESEKQAFLSNLNLQIDKAGDHLVTSSFRSSILLFDSVGNYKKRLIDIGRAKHEIQNRLHHWAWQNGRLTLCQGNKMITYTPASGKVKGFLSEQYYYNTLLLKDGHYVALPNLGPEMNDSRYLDFLDSEYKVVKSIAYPQQQDIYYSLPQSYTGCLETYGLYPSYTGDALFKDLFNDTIYQVKDINTIVPYIHLKRGDLLPTVKNVTQTPANKDLIYIKHVAESEKYVFVNYGYKESVFSAILSKNNEWPPILTEIKLDNATSINNSKYFIDYVTPKGKKIKAGILTVGSDRLYCVVKTEDAIDFMPEMDEYDNPLILEVILK